MRCVIGAAAVSFAYRITAPRFAGAIVLLGIVAACSGASEQDVLSNQIGSAATSSGGTTSGNTTSGNTSGQTSGNTSGQTSGNTSGQTSGNTGGCADETENDSSENAQLTITSCARGQIAFPSDREDWLQFERPKGTKFSANWSGPLNVVFWDEDGKSYDSIERLPGKEGTYSIQIQYDFRKFPLNGDQIGKNPVFPWTFNISFN